MTVAPDNIKLARARADAARARLTDTVGEIKAHLAPESILHNVGEKLKDNGQAIAQSGMETARRNPAIAAGAAAAAVLLLARRPIARLFGRGDAD